MIKKVFLLSRPRTDVISTISMSPRVNTFSLPLVSPPEGNYSMCAFLGPCFSGTTLVCLCVFGQEGKHYWVHVSLVLRGCLFTTHDNCTHLRDSTSLLCVWLHSHMWVWGWICMCTVCAYTCDCKCLCGSLCVCAWAPEVCTSMHDLVVLCVSFVDDCLNICVLCMYVWQFEDTVIGWEKHFSQIRTRVGEEGM